MVVAHSYGGGVELEEQDKDKSSNISSLKNIKEPQIIHIMESPALGIEEVQDCWYSGQQQNSISKSQNIAPPQLMELYVSTPLRPPPGRIKRFLLGHFGCFFPEGASDVGDIAPRPALPPNTASEQAIIARMEQMSDAEFIAAYDTLVQARLAGKESKLPPPNNCPHRE
ncbi:hypothetical protein MN608_11464 [Microdochium nivale]|nr:hypothetical protein MN608_11464 [Microdochium nivale]